MFSEMKCASTCTCPYRIIDNWPINIDNIVTPGVFEQDSVIVWTDYANFVTIFNDLEYFNSGTSPKRK